MEIIELARSLGKKIQDDERFIQLQIAKQQMENDEFLQGVIGEFNLKKMSINNEASKKNVDSDKIQKLNEELQESYKYIMTNENMIKFNEKKAELDGLLRRIFTIITRSAEGEDPDVVDYEESTCSGNCGSCGGCH